MSTQSKRRISLGYLTVSGVSLAEHITVAAKAGYQSVGLRLLGSRPPEPEHFRNEAALREAEKRLADTGVTVLDSEIFWLKPETNVSAYTALFDAMERLKSRLLLVLSVDPDQQRLFDNFAALCEATAPHNILPCLEFCKITSVETLQQAVSIVQRTGQPNAHVLVDALHLSRSGGTPQEVAQIEPSLFEYAQLCDAPAQIPDLERMRAEPLDRLLPGQGGLPLLDLVRALPPDLPISIEAPVKALEHLPLLERARLALHGMNTVLESAATAPV